MGRNKENSKGSLRVSHSFKHKWKLLTVSDSCPQDKNPPSTVCWWGWWLKEQTPYVYWPPTSGRGGNIFNWEKHNVVSSKLKKHTVGGERACKVYTEHVCTYLYGGCVPLLQDWVHKLKWSCFLLKVNSPNASALHCLSMKGFFDDYNHALQHSGCHCYQAAY